MHLLLHRYNYTDSYTQGVLMCEGVWICDTLELPWKDNHQRISCIPVGMYDVQKRLSEKFGEVVRVLNVTGREGILIHAGNKVSDVQGCILPGIKSNDIVISSRIHLRKILELVKNKAVLEVKKI